MKYKVLAQIRLQEDDAIVNTISTCHMSEGSSDHKAFTPKKHNWRPHPYGRPNQVHNVNDVSEYAGTKDKIDLLLTLRSSHMASSSTSKTLSTLQPRLERLSVGRGKATAQTLKRIRPSGVNSTTIMATKQKDALCFEARSCSC